MIIGIDVSQLAYPATGVGRFISELVEELANSNRENTYLLFFSSLRKTIPDSVSSLSRLPNVQIKTFKLPPTLLDFLWNKLHIVPIETFIGKVDIFVTSDWTEPPARNAKKVTVLYDLIIYKYPKETDEKIVATQKRKLKWVKKESSQIICISEATKHDAVKLLGIDEKRLKVVYPGI